MDRTAISADLASRLIAAQFPHWAGLPVRPVDVDGWDNSSFRLGADLSGPSRQVFKDRLPVDPAAWVRGRGWALWKAMIVLVDALKYDPQDAAATRGVIAQILADQPG